MDSTRSLRKVIAGAVLSVGVAAGLGLTAAGTAEAGGWPGCPKEGNGPCHWCPGDPPVHTGNMVNDPVIWDNNVCHTFWYVNMGQGNVAKEIWDGDDPPAPPPPPPPPPFVIDRSNCQQILGIFCPHA
jgi:hypothetical protein